MSDYTNIVIDGSVQPIDVEAGSWSSSAYEAAVRANLEIISGTEVGQAVLHHLCAVTLIVPFRGRWVDPNALVQTHTRGEDGLAYPLDESSLESRGIGAPAVELAYTPAMFRGPYDRPELEFEGLYPFRSDATLLHELVHAVEAGLGTLRQTVVGIHPFDIEKTSELRAVRVQNMYHSERNYPFRGPYRHVAPMDPTCNTYARDGRGALEGEARFCYGGNRTAEVVRREPLNPRHQQFVEFENQLIGEFLIDCPEFTDALHRIPRERASYNPFRDFFSGRYDRILLESAWDPVRLDSILDHPPTRTRRLR